MKFNLKELYEKQNTKQQTLQYKPDNKNLSYATIGNRKEIEYHIPEAGNMIFIWTQVQFSALDVIPFIVAKHPIEEMFLSSFTININIFNALLMLVRSQKIKQCNLFLSNTIQRRLPKVYEQLKTYENTSNIKIVYGWNHSKITLFKTEKDYYCLEGSGNFSKNARFEQFLFSNNIEIYDFRRRCFAGYFE